MVKSAATARRLARQAAALALLLVANPSRAVPDCEVSIEIEPRRAFVGQPIEHRTVVVRAEGIAVSWAEPLRFPGFRSEILEPGSATRTELTGASTVRVVTPRVLFAARPGPVELPIGRLRCGKREIGVASPPIEALAWPALGRPAGFTGVVGQVTIDVASEPAVALGSSVRVHVTSRGAANLWDARHALQVEPRDTEVFAGEPRVTLHRGKGPVAIRHDTFDLVPRHAGALRVAPLTLTYLDPASGHYRVAESRPIEIRVLPGATSASRTAANQRSVAPPATPDEGDTSGATWPWVASALLVAALGALGIRKRLGAPVDATDAALREADRAPDADSRSAALERALRAHLADRGAEPPRSGTQSSLEDSPDRGTGEYLTERETVTRKCPTERENVARECLAALDELERARFGGSGPGSEFEERLAAIRALLARARVR